MAQAFQKQAARDRREHAVRAEVRATTGGDGDLQVRGKPDFTYSAAGVQAFPNAITNAMAGT